MADAIDDAGGRQKFNAFLRSKLKTGTRNWIERLEIKRSAKDGYPDICQILMSTSIYRGRNELVLWDTMYFYKFDLGVDYDKAFERK